MLRKLVPCIAAALLVVGCGEDSEAPVEAEIAGFHVRVESSPAHLVVTGADDRVLIDSMLGGKAGEGNYDYPFLVAAKRTVGAEITFQSGAHRFEDYQMQPWTGVTQFRNLAVAGDTITFDLRAGSETVGTGTIAGVADGQLSITLDTGEGNRASFAYHCDPQEHFIGFGGQTAAVDHFGDTVPLWVEEDGISKQPVDTYDWGIWFLHGRLHSTHTPMPIFMSSRGYGMLLDTAYRSVFSMCSEKEGEAVRIEAWEPELRMHLFDGPDPASVMQRLTDHVGRPDVPPAFTFAPWIDAIYGSDNVRRVANKLRTEKIPVAAIWSEDWRGAEDSDLGYTLDEDWDLDRDLYPDFETLSGELHDLGFKFLTYNNSFLDSTTDTYQEAVAGDYTIKDSTGATYLFEGVKFNDTTLLDLTNPAAVAWAKGVFRTGLEQGSDGYMADFAEWLPFDAVLSDGDDPMRHHNLYPVEWQRLNKELFDEMYDEDGIERLFFVRSAYLGSQPLVSVVWAGDQQTDFTTDDGLPSIIPIGIGLGATGFPYYGHDIAGYMSQLTVPVTRELWYRWVTLGAMSPVMRTHHGRSARDNWHWESDAESTQHFKRWATLHIRLFPYLYAHAELASRTGMPMFRALAYSYPSFSRGWSSMDQYMLGDRLIVAPIVEESATTRDVHLPPGEYFEFTTGQHVVVSDDTPVTASAAVGEIPVFVPVGTMLVLLPPDVDTLAKGSAAGIVDLESVGADRELWLWPAGDDSFTEVSGGAYTWQGASLAAGAVITSASQGGQTLTVQTDAEGAFVELSQSGEVTINGTATLTVPATSGRIIVRLRGS